MKNNLFVQGIEEAPKAQRSKMDTIFLTHEFITSLVIPDCQRPLKVNSKVRQFAEEIKLNGNVVNGVITLGTLQGRSRPLYLLDGRHRCEAIKIANIEDAIADVRIVDYDNIGEMGEDWVKMNSSLVKMTPDNILHAMEKSLPSLSYIKSHCDFIGYVNIRKTPTSAMLSMSSAFRCWQGGISESAAQRGAVLDIARDMPKDEYEKMAEFLLLVREAWGNHPEYSRLWGPLNLTLCAWLFRRMVLFPPVKKGKASRPHDSMTKGQFKNCLMALSARHSYLDWLVGRNMISDRDRGPALAKIKGTFGERFFADNKKAIRLPKPEWA
jgi:hypothetical protein